MHVVQLGPYPPPEGGVSRNMLAIHDELERRGDQCSIIATTKSSRIDDAPNVYHPGGPIGMIRLLASMRFDILHLHVGGDINSRVMALAAAVAFFGRGKCVLTVHSGQFPLTDQARNARPGSIRGRIFNKFSKIIAVSDAIADVFRRYGVTDERISVIVPFEPKLPDPEVTVPSSLKDFVNDHSPLLLSVGGLEPDYDPAFQIEAFGDVLAEFPGAGLMIIGDGSMRHLVESSIEKSGCKDRIFLGGNVSHDIVLHLINSADVMLRTTRFDGDAISVREALLLGTPVIATDNSVRPDGVRLITIGDRRGLIRELIEIVNGDTKTRKPPDADNANIREIVDLYQKLL